jgi:hypothetical protein
MVNIARLMIFGGLLCGAIGLWVGIDERAWKLGVTGWFMGGTLLAVLAGAILLDEIRRQKSVF